MSARLLLAASPHRARHDERRRPPPSALHIAAHPFRGIRVPTWHPRSESSQAGCQSDPSRGRAQASAPGQPLGTPVPRNGSVLTPLRLQPC
ncbi:Hypothetical protein AA314_02646 [Archangium gephyra]|uniref:Uncharacterized protein n=1 Tax=Archangium gephyra TaxID=48 RepID=A0AAC8TCM4_9BACT|nr:Hypothetical protein AA314_02646 [Archangium gephyra]